MSVVGVALVALEGGHVNVTIATGRLSPRRGTCSTQSRTCSPRPSSGTAAGAEAARSIALLEFRLGVYRFPLWLFKTLFAAGLALLTTIQLVLNTSVKHLALAVAASRTPA